jgi:hypothetical protein
MTRRVIYIGLFFLLMSAACVDRLSFENVGEVGADAVVVEGFITDQPGPYEIRISQAYNIDSTVVRRIPVEAGRLFMSDNLGNSEVLKEISDGVYQTDINGIQGIVGRAYKVRVEFTDGRTYETPFDTMRSTGFIQDISHQLVKYTNRDGVAGYAFDIYFNAKTGEKSNYRYLWKTSMTYKVQTNPEDHTLDCGRTKCQDPLDCSGYIINPNGGGLLWVKPCTCCFCWISIRSEVPVVSDDIVERGTFSHVKAGQVPVTGLTMSYKTRVNIQQLSLSEQAYKFWKAFRAQKDGIASLFQPANGKVTGNWVQVAGTAKPIFGLFYASSVSSSAADVSISDLPSASMVPPVGMYFPYSCLDFDNSTNIQPDLWNVE